jgi:conjugal transfer pilus assembly protein TraB
MQTDALRNSRWRARGTLCVVALAASALLVAALLLLPVDGSRAATTDPAGSAGPNASEAGDGGKAEFGTATPNDQFVQSFQQQVSRQLQSALTQARQEEESHLQSYAAQQRDLQEQVQSLQKALDALSGPAPGNRTAGADERPIDPPQINVRRPVAPDAAEAAPAPAGLGSLLAPGLLGAPGIAEAGDAAGDRRVPGSAIRSSHAGDPNIAPHGFVEGRLLNGVVSIVGGPDRESVVTLTGSYQSANGFVDDLDGCLVLVQGKPEIAAGRIDFKVSRLTCNFPDGASRTWDAAGWLVDADGIRGVRATIVENVGRKAAVAAAGGALAGMGQRLSQEQYQINSLSGGAGIGAVGTSSTFVGSPGRDALGGAANGASGALGQSISDYYNLYSPSLQVGGGTPVTVVLANDLRLPPSGRGISQTHTANP